MTTKTFHQLKSSTAATSFLIGGTGFLGKVTLSMLLHRFPNIGRVYVTVRARSQEESETRFWNNVITAPPFDPLRERYGSALEGFIRDKVVDRRRRHRRRQPRLHAKRKRKRIADDIDVVINCAGNVTFNPTLESALRTNVVGTQNVIAFAKRMKRPAWSTSRPVLSPAIAPARSGKSDQVLGYFPRKRRTAGRRVLSRAGDRDCAKTGRTRTRRSQRRDDGGALSRAGAQAAERRRCATPTILTRSGWPSRANEKSGRARA